MLSLRKPQSPIPLRTAGPDSAAMVALRLDDTRLDWRSLSAVDVDAQYCLDAPSYMAGGSCLADPAVSVVVQREVTR